MICHRDPVAPRTCVEIASALPFRRVAFSVAEGDSAALWVFRTAVAAATHMLVSEH